MRVKKSNIHMYIHVTSFMPYVLTYNTVYFDIYMYVHTYSTCMHHVIHVYTSEKNK